MNIYFRDMGSVCCVTCFNIDYENVRKVLSDLSKYLWVGEHKYTPVKGNKFGAPMNERFSDKISESYRWTLFTSLFAPKPAQIESYMYTLSVKIFILCLYRQ